MGLLGILLNSFFLFAIYYKTQFAVVVQEKNIHFRPIAKIGGRMN